ncbi:MAG: hypothetical protein ACRENH_02605 [Gemmatimonadaceae bacterium]
MVCMLAAGSTSAQRQPRARVQEAEVAIQAVGAVARVRARYTFAGNPGAISFEYLEQPCAVMQPIRLESNGKQVPYAGEVTGPWVRLHDTSAADPERASLRYQITYDVKLAATDVSVPIVLPTSAVVGTRRGEAIAIIHAWLPPRGRVILPRMTFTPSTRSWSTRIAALPSAVRLAEAGVPNEKCWLEPKNSGGLAGIFWALVATLALWVPTYLWWANRRRDVA